MKRILTIDGGGIKGVFPASFLATVEDTINDNIANYFDLIVGTSTGGIIAMGLGLGLSAKEILDFYEESGPYIFGGNRFLRSLRWLGIAKYSSKKLKEKLSICFDQRKLGDSTKRLVIPCTNLETGEVHVYKTAHHPRLQRDYKEDAIEAVLATTAAPTYFRPHSSFSGVPLTDGGIWANNPVCVAVIEAISVLNWSRDSIKVLSIGCTTEPLKINWGRRSSLGIIYWAKKLINLLYCHRKFGPLSKTRLWYNIYLLERSIRWRNENEETSLPSSKPKLFLRHLRVKVHKRNCVGDTTSAMNNSQSGSDNFLKMQRPSLNPLISSLMPI